MNYDNHCYARVMELINNSIRTTRLDNWEGTERNEAYTFLSGYVRALSDFHLLTEGECYLLGQEMKKI
ncbi:hypothetical protein [Zophobihabitans entericus]|uniref:Uncharacterized protein n=1 Tax=Zophobihabitans entericus TaxID=1635327 RepID=A0A6G9IE69_9GAMM|nr:hypothetical protein [Zophobihabitans entericus]QIQ22536.1 hypothetical protein IPMB12_12075 [Zophobihabitans entericus]